MNISSNRQEKEKRVADLVNLIQKSTGTIIVDIGDMKAQNICALRKKFYDMGMTITMDKNRIIKQSFEQLGIKLDASTWKQAKMSVVTTDSSVWTIKDAIDKNISYGPAKVGTISDKDITAPKGDTGEKPGPLLSQLQKAGVKCGIKGPTIHVLQDSVVIKKGDKVTTEQVEVLNKLKIFPTVEKLTYRAGTNGKLVYTDALLKEHGQECLDKLSSVLGSSLGLMLEIDYPSSLVIGKLIGKCVRTSTYIKDQAEVLDEQTIGKIIVRKEIIKENLSSQLKK